MKGILPGLFLAAVCLLPLQAQILEDFDSLDRWKPLTFRKIDSHTRYDLTVEETPIVEWGWKISNTIPEGNAEEKSGDDSSGCGRRICRAVAVPPGGYT